PYERLKDLTRGHSVGAKEMREFVLSLNLPADVEERLVNLTPASYIGVAAKLVL
ncbi:MAG: adenylosuccinate lyase, partial [Trueperella sp.]|nr:adenylosuccinate lyase [Trueperella sp.]